MWIVLALSIVPANRSGVDWDGLLSSAGIPSVVSVTKLSASLLGFVCEFMARVTGLKNAFSIFWLVEEDVSVGGGVRLVIRCDTNR